MTSTIFDRDRQFPRGQARDRLNVAIGATVVRKIYDLCDGYHVLLEEEAAATGAGRRLRELAAAAGIQVRPCSLGPQPDCLDIDNAAVVPLRTLVVAAERANRHPDTPVCVASTIAQPSDGVA